MPFAITRAQSQNFPPLYAVVEPDGEILWDARKSNATQFSESDADQIAASITEHSTADIAVVGVRNTVE